MLNPLNARTYTLSFSVLSSATGSTDALGNPTYSTTTVTVEALLSKLGPKQLQDLQQQIGVDNAVMGFKVRAAEWPDEVRRMQPAIATLTYNGRAARLVLAPIAAPNDNVVAASIDLGESAQGLLTYV
jgi:hypothetical protein